MPTETSVRSSIPCGHAEITQRWQTAETQLVFCARCQRGYEAPPRPDADALDERFILDTLASALL